MSVVKALSAVVRGGGDGGVILTAMAFGMAVEARGSD